MSKTSKRPAPSASQLHRHTFSMAHPIYRAGYEGPNHWVPPYPENPYVFPEALSIEQAQIAALPRSLTNPEKARLAELRDLIGATDWALWSRGNHYRYCVEPEHQT